MKTDSIKTHFGLKCAVACVSMPLGALLSTFVERRLWAWFATPTFHIAVPGYGMLLGLSTLGYALFARKKAPKDEPVKTVSEYLGEVLGLNILLPLVVWGMGYLFHLLAIA